MPQKPRQSFDRHFDRRWRHIGEDEDEIRDRWIPHRGLDRNSPALLVASRSPSDLLVATRPNSRKSSRDEKMAPSIDQRHVRGGTSLVLSSARSLICEQPPRCSIANAPFLRSNHVGSHGNGVTTRSVLQLASSCGSSAEDGVQRGGRELIYSVFWIDFDRPIDP